MGLLDASPSSPFSLGRASTRRCGALHCFHPSRPYRPSVACHQVTRFAVSPCCSLTHQRNHAAAASKRHTAPFLSTVPSSCLPVSTAVLGWLAERVCARVPPLYLSPAGWENPGALCQPCGETFPDVSGWVSRRADPDRQSDDGRPLLFSRPCRRVCVFYLCICNFWCVLIWLLLALVSMQAQR